MTEDNNYLGIDLFKLHPLPYMLSSVCIPYTCGAYLLATIIHVVKGSYPYHLGYTGDMINSFLLNEMLEVGTGECRSIITYYYLGQSMGHKKQFQFLNCNIR